MAPPLPVPPRYCIGPHTWVQHQGETRRLAVLARRLGVDHNRLSTYLRDCLEGGVPARVRGHRLTLATPAEQEQALLLEQTRLVACTAPDGSTRTHNLRGALSRICRHQGSSVTQEQLIRHLNRHGVFRTPDHDWSWADEPPPRLNETEPMTDPKQAPQESAEQQQQAPETPQQAIAPTDEADQGQGQPEKTADDVSRFCAPPAPPAPPAAETPAPAKRRGGKFKPVLVDGVRYPSVTDAARQLGLSHKALSQRLSRAGGRVVLNGAVVVLEDAPPAAPRPVLVNGAVVPSVTDAAKQVGASWTAAKRAAEAQTSINTTTLAYADQAGPGGPAAAAEDGDRPAPPAPPAPPPAAPAEHGLSSDVVALVVATAERQQVSPDLLVLRALPTSPALANVLALVEPDQLAPLQPTDWHHLQALARAHACA